MQEGTYNGVDELGKKLSTLIDCSVRCTGLLFICKRHEAKFSVETLQHTDDWSWAKTIHDGKKVEV